MTAIPAGPIDEPPVGALRVPVDGQMSGVRPSWVHEVALTHALRGVTLGAYDQVIIRCLADICDGPMAATLASLIERARTAGDGQ